eukprot:5174668-Pyramimonas_sp.AAC.1
MCGEHLRRDEGRAVRVEATVLPGILGGLRRRMRVRVPSPAKARDWTAHAADGGRRSARGGLPPARSATTPR